MYPIISHLLELRGILGGGVGEFLSLLSGVPGEEMPLSAATAASAADVPGGGMPALSRERRKSGDLKYRGDGYPDVLSLAFEFKYFWQP